MISVIAISLSDITVLLSSKTLEYIAEYGVKVLPPDCDKFLKNGPNAHCAWVLQNAKDKSMKWIDKLPVLPLAIISILLFAAPFVPEPHVFEKLKMLMSGELTRLVDIFDLLMHTTPMIILLLRLIRISKKN